MCTQLTKVGHNAATAPQSTIDTHRGDYNLWPCKRDWHGNKAEKKQGCPKGPPPDAVHMSSKLVGPEPVQNTLKITCSSRHPR